MAFFTKFKKAKEAAVEHKKIAAAQESKPPAAPYRHIPTHAAQDALNAHPTVLKPAELQARIAAAKKRRASYSSYQSPMAQRHSIYHSTDPSRASSRAPSIASSPRSTASSLKGKGREEHSIDGVVKRQRSASYHQSPAHLQPGEYFPQIPDGPLAKPLPVSQRRPPVSSRSSFANRKSPLSTVSVDEGTFHHMSMHVALANAAVIEPEPEHVYTGSSNTSDKSSRTFRLRDVYHTRSFVNRQLQHGRLATQQQERERAKAFQQAKLRRASHHASRRR